MLEGVVLETGEDGVFLMENEAWGKVLVKTNAATQWEGLQGPETGAWITIVYSGVITKSLPPQVTAGRVSCYRLEGTVLEADERAGAVLLDTLGNGRVLVRLPETAVIPAAGDIILVYTDGVLAMSDPGQVKALKVATLRTQSGSVTQVEEGFFLMDGPTGLLRVNVGETTRMPELPMPGDQLTVYYNGVMTRSIPPQIWGYAVVSDGD